jgi:hypothetical protein
LKIALITWLAIDGEEDKSNGPRPVETNEAWFLLEETNCTILPPIKEVSLSATNQA